MPESQIIHFLLVPDSGASRRLRRELASHQARVGVLVGVWSELMALGLENYFVSRPENCWNETLHRALQVHPEAFWSGSYKNAPEETSGVISKAYTQLIQETDPRASFEPFSRAELPGRGGVHLRDLGVLHETLGDALPDDLGAIRMLLGMGADEGIRQLCIYTTNTFPRLSTWQLALIDHFNVGTAQFMDAALQQMLDALRVMPEGTQYGDSSLSALQKHLFDMPDTVSSLDGSIQWLGVRDFYEEAEVAAGMVQTLLKDNSSLALRDIGLLVPERSEYAYALNDAFRVAGLPMAGLSDSNWRRDLGRELILNFLHVRESPAPAMGVAACVTSPLMPWSLEEGAVAAQRVIDGDWKVSSWHGASDEAEAILKLLRDSDVKGGTLAYALRKLAKHLDSGIDFAADTERARVACEQVCVALDKDEPVDWVSIRGLVHPERLSSAIETEFSLEGLTIWHEGREPWRPVRHLLVLGFAAGHYPNRGYVSAVFSPTDIHQLVEGKQLAIDTQRAQLDRARAQFKRQLNMTSDSASFFVPKRDPAGNAQSPSESLQFMLHMFGKEEDEILSLDLSVDRAQACHLAENTVGDVQPPSVRPFRDIDIGKDLFFLRVDAEGNPKPESPSALERMMVSPLAWLLQRLYAEPAVWVAEEANVLLQGTLSHSVFEALFRAGSAPPLRGQLPGLVKIGLEQAIQRSAPFMQSATWTVERRLLEAQLTKAAQAWHDMLTQLGAEVIGTEVWLKGHLGSLGIHGQADALLALPGNRLLIVDYKKSSASSRRTRMERGYDSQVELYRKMLQTGGLKDEEKVELGDQLKSSDEIGVVYYNMNDTTALSDTGLAESSQLPGWEVLESDVSSEAISLINERISELHTGKIRLNRNTDAEFFDKKAGVKPYALEVTPLTSLFMVADEEDRQ